MDIDAFPLGKYITASDVLTLRRSVFADGIVSRTEMLKVFTLGNKHPDGDPEWATYYIEVLCDFFLNEELPKGYLTDEEYSFIAREMIGDDKIINILELQGLIGLQKRAVSTPNDLTHFVQKNFLSYVRNKQPKPHLSEFDVDLLRVNIYAMGGGSQKNVSKDEADFLFDLNDLIEGRDNHETWQDLFKKAVAAHLMANFQVDIPNRENARETQKWLEDTSIDPVEFLSKATEPEALSDINGKNQSLVSRILDPTTARDFYQEHLRQQNKVREASAQIAHQLTLDESNWLWARIIKHGRVSENELALLNHLKYTVKAKLPEQVAALI